MRERALTDAREKLRWAERHLALLKSDIERFQDANPYRITVEPNFDTGKYTFRVFGIKDYPMDCGLIVGDCIHNVRTALDYMMIRIVALTTGQDPRDIEDVQFPIYHGKEAAKRFNSDATVQIMRKNQLLRGHWTRIEELQPYHNGNPSIWGTERLRIIPSGRIVGSTIYSPVPSALERINVLDNIDKHRIVHVVQHRADWFRKRYPVLPPGFHMVASDVSLDGLKDGTEIGMWQFELPIPSGWVPAEVEMQRAFPIYPSIDDSLIRPHSVLDILRVAIWAAGTVLDLFEPVFGDHLQPPLPVTQIPPMPDDPDQLLDMRAHPDDEDEA